MAQVEGLRYLENWLSVEEANAILAQVDGGQWMNDLQRRVQHYGYRYDYKARKIVNDAYLGPLPAWSLPVVERLVAEGVCPEAPDQLIVNEYEPGQGISKHVDCVPCFSDTIVSITLGSSALMQFRQLKTGEICPILLMPGSLVAMQGEARYQWQHEIPARKTDNWQGRKWQRGRRVSLTFRKVLLEEQ